MSLNKCRAAVWQAVFVAPVLIASGWTPAVAAATAVCPSQAGTTLRFVEVFDGTVEEMASLVPDRAKASAGYWTLGYVYDAGRFVTVRCKYADDRVVDVKLADKVQRCDYKINAKKVLQLSCK